MEHPYIPRPKATGGTIPVSLGDKTENFPAYEAEGFPALKWSGKMPLPGIGDRIYVRMNSLGWAKVEGYYESAGYLGLMVLPEDPPEWYIRQVHQKERETRAARRIGPEKAKLERIREWPNWIRRGVGVVFGAEIALTKD